MSVEQEPAGALEPGSRQSTGRNGSEILNENHRLQLRLTFQHIDSILTEVEQILAEPERNSPFSPYTSDITPVQRRITRDYAARVRATMTKIMREQAIAFGHPHCGTRWAALTAVLGAVISAEELTPDRMRGYGEVPAPGNDLLETIRMELNLVLSNLQAYLEQCGNADLEERVQRIAEDGDEGLLIKQLDRIITTHGLVEYRNALAMIVGRAGNQDV
jgi:hypothetical protein